MKKNFCLIFTATIEPKGMTFLVKSKAQDRYEDYSKAFNSWCSTKSFQPKKSI